LAPCVSHWQTQQTMAEQRADATLERLQVRLAQR
ncbi:metal-chelation protein CHAD, partial [Pseudomonas frederiksbergensis]|nr:metal-chelation protein CHAD [Pseudomonas frederiksbergensis]